MKTLIILFFLSSLFLVWGNARQSELDTTRKLPDLIIESVTYKRVTFKKVPNYNNGNPSSTFGGNGLNLEFTLQIKNIGSAPFEHPLFISNSRNERDIQMGHYSHGQRPYYDSTLTNHTIAPGQVISVRVEDIFFEAVSRVKFLINDDGKPHIKKTLLPPKYDELNYDNNTFELEIKK